MKSFRLKLLAADKAFYDGGCLSLTVPSPDGKYGILAEHCNAVIAVTPGIALFTTADGQKISAFVASGIVKIEHGQALMLVESCYNAEDADDAKAKKAVRDAQEDAARRESRFNVLAAEIRIARALGNADVTDKQ